MRPNIINEILLLKQAQEVIDTPDKWTTQVAARDARGAEVAPEDESAVCWCTYGALSKAMQELRKDRTPQYLYDAHSSVCDLLARIIYKEYESDLFIADFNDVRGYDAVKKLLARGEEILRKEMANG